MTQTLLDPAGYRRMPWKNGGGTTTEIAVAPSADASGRFLWRVSVADVGQSGPFSAFDSYERLIAVVEGTGMRLTIDGVATEARRGDPAVRFSGDAKVQCDLLDGPIRDFNLMVDRERARGSLDIVTAEHAVSVPAARVVLIHAVDGAVTVCRDGGGVRVPAGWTLRLDGEGGTVDADEGAWAFVARVDDR
ncbi:HutD/Ves family protein [Azospirillum sp.]|uniref:HutD/Ves family protein n=1 Tax=Azospirillum sp. TaxID=34012 RepID=UPI003D70D9C1